MTYITPSSEVVRAQDTLETPRWRERNQIVQRWPGVRSKQGSCDLFKHGDGRDKSYLSPKGPPRAVEVAVTNIFGAAALGSHCSACPQFRVPQSPPCPASVADDLCTLLGPFLLDAVHHGAGTWHPGDHAVLAGSAKCHPVDQAVGPNRAWGALAVLRRAEHPWWAYN